MSLDELIEELNRQREIHGGNTTVKFESLNGDIYAINKVKADTKKMPRVILLKP